MVKKETQDGTMPTAPMPTTPEPETPATGGSMGKMFAVVAVLLLLGATGAASYFYKQLSEIKKNPNKVAQDETSATIAAVGKLMVLPTGEQPTLATVTDTSKLKDQPFFANSQNGDKVLIYTNAKQAILYRPSDNKIVAVAPVNIGDQTNVSGASTSTAKTTTTKSTTSDTKK